MSSPSLALLTSFSALLGALLGGSLSFWATRWDRRRARHDERTDAIRAACQEIIVRCLSVARTHQRSGRWRREAGRRAVVELQASAFLFLTQTEALDCIGTELEQLVDDGGSAARFVDQRPTGNTMAAFMADVGQFAVAASRLLRSRTDG